MAFAARMRFEYDMVVIGGGAAGLTAAGMSAVLGAKTALIEAARLGGDCTWHGCVPSKALLKAAAVAHEMRTASRFGLAEFDEAHQFARVMGRVREIREEIYREADAPPNMERLGVEAVAGRARFVDDHAVETDDGRRITSRWFVIATGSSPIAPSGLNALTNETIFESSELPRAMLVAGAGPLGIEMAQAFARFGSKVTVVERSNRILGRDDAELADMLRVRLEAEGVRFEFGKTAEEMEGAFDVVLAAMGRRANTEGLNLAAVGVRAGANGIEVDDRCRTSRRHIYASGDVIGGPYFTHFAEHSAKVAVTNAILPMGARVERAMPWCTFTDPELAHVGALEGERVYRLPVKKIDRARLESADDGMIKVFATRKGRVLGASILAARAGEMIGEFALAIKNGILLDEMSATVHPYPTWVLGDRQAADLQAQSRLTPRVGWWLRKLRGLRGDRCGITALAE